MQGDSVSRTVEEWVPCKILNAFNKWCVFLACNRAWQSVPNYMANQEGRCSFGSTSITLHSTLQRFWRSHVMSKEGAVRHAGVVCSGTFRRRPSFWRGSKFQLRINYPWVDPFGGRVAPGGGTNHGVECRHAPRSGGRVWLAGWLAGGLAKLQHVRLFPSLAS